MVFNCTYLTFYVLWMCTMINKIDFPGPDIIGQVPVL